MTRPFAPASWLPGPHLQTLWPALLRPRPAVRWHRERWELPDGDFIDLDWGPEQPGPWVIILHGLEGSSRSGYVAGLAKVLSQHTWQVLVMHFRGCSGEPNRLRRSYHAAASADLQQLITLLSAREPTRPLYVVGFSLGGNVLLKWLGESPEVLPPVLHGAVAVSVPFHLEMAAARLDRGLSRLYQAYLLRSLRRSYRRKFRHRPDPPLPLADISGLRRLVDFDQAITAPLHGFDNAWHYYQVASCHQYLRAIRHPTLIIQARDDPFSEPQAIPEPSGLSSSVTLECHPQGGHVGFVEGTPWHPGYYLERRIPAWLATIAS